MTETDQTVYDREGNVVDNPDLELGEIVVDTVIRPDAEPVDGVAKHAWADTDYAERRTYVPYSPERLEAVRAGRAREAFLSDGPRAQSDTMAAVGELGVLVAAADVTMADLMAAVAELGVLVAADKEVI